MKTKFENRQKNSGRRNKNSKIRNKTSKKRNNISKKTQKKVSPLKGLQMEKKNMYLVIPEMPSKTFVML